MAKDRKKRLKKRWLLLLLLLLLGTGGGLLSFARPIRQALESAGMEPFRRAREKAGEKLPVFAHSIRATARYRPGWSLDWIPLTAETVLSEGDEVVVDDGTLTLQTGNFSLLALGPSSKIRVSQLTGSNATFKLLEGQASLRVEGAPGGGEIALETASMRYVTTRGFSSVATSEAGDAVRVFDGEVTLAGGGGAAAMRLSQQDGTRSVARGTEGSVQVAATTAPQARLEDLARDLLTSAMQLPLGGTGSGTFDAAAQEDRIRSVLSLLLQGLAERDPAIMAAMSRDASFLDRLLASGAVNQRILDFLQEHQQIAAEASPGSIRTRIDTVTTPQGTVQVSQPVTELTLAPSGVVALASPSTLSLAAPPPVSAPAPATAATADASGAQAASGTAAGSGAGSTALAPQTGGVESTLLSSSSIPITYQNIYQNVVTATATAEFDASLNATETITQGTGTGQQQMLTCLISSQKSLRFKLKWVRGEWMLTSAEVLE